MKIFITVLIAFTLGSQVRADDVVMKISNAHFCCSSCSRAVAKAVDTVPGAAALVNEKEDSVELVAPDTESLQKAANAVVDAGFFGTSSDPKIKIENNSGAKGKKVKSLEVTGVHLCCGECVAVVDEAIKSVPGAESHTAVKGAKSFEVKGNFKDSDFFTALQKGGLSGKVK